MLFNNDHESFDSPRDSHPLSNDKCQNILYKAAFEHSDGLQNIAVVLLTSKSFQNSSFGANFLLKYRVDDDTVHLFDYVLSPSSCLSLQFVSSLHITNVEDPAEDVYVTISNFIEDLVKTKYLHLQLRSLTLDRGSSKNIKSFFGPSSSSSSWPQLRSLNFPETIVTDADVAFIAKSAPQLSALTFGGGSTLTDVSLQHISNLPLVHLDLCGCGDITDAGIEHLSDREDLTSLGLYGCGNVTNAALQHIVKCSNLTALDVGWLQITDAGLEIVSHLLSVATLNLNGCDKVADDGLKHVAKLSRLTFLNLSWCSGLTDVGMSNISSLPSILQLHLAWCRALTDDGLAHISNLSTITTLNMSGCVEITDNGLKDISKLAQLHRVDLTLCQKITDEAVEKFLVERPNCHITNYQ